MKCRVFRISITVLLAMAILPALVHSEVLPTYRHICLDMANGAFYDDSAIIGSYYDRACTPIAFEQYYHKFDGGGLNEIHLTMDLNQPLGDVYNLDNPSGTFYITDTGGKGYVDEAILLVSINADSLPPEFSLRIRSSGYEIVTNSSQVITDSTYKPDALDWTFTADDFADYGYGPQTWKPAGVADYPLWSGQDVNDSSTASLLLFIDLNVASVKAGMITGAENDGAAKVAYTFTGLPGTAAFNIYGFNFYSSQGQGISWSNDTDGSSSGGPSGLTVNPQASGGWGVAEAEAASGSAAGKTGNPAANVLLAVLLPVALVTGWKLLSGRCRVRV